MIMSKKKMFFSVPRLPQGDFRLNFNNANTDYVLLDNNIPLTGVFEITCNFSFNSEVNSYASVFGGSVSRLIVSSSLNRVLISVGGTNPFVSQAFSLNTDYEIVLKRNASNQIYYNLNGGGDVLITTNAAQFNVINFGAGTNPAARTLNGYIKDINVNGEFFALNEGSGANISGDSGSTGVIQTTQDLAYINNTMWEQI